MNRNMTEFMEFLNHSPSGYHAVANLVKLLQDAGYTQIREHEEW